jgi:hypothetical protein
MNNNNNYNPLNFSDKEWFDIFPQARRRLKEKRDMLEQRILELEELIKREFKTQKNVPKQDWWFKELQIKIWYVWDLVKAEEEIYRIKIVLSDNKDCSAQEELWHDKVEHAKSILVQDIASHKGVKLRRVGRALVGLCPFHQEKTPSFYIYPQSNIFKCYGCGQGGGPIKLVMSLNKFSFKGAVEFLNYSF